MAKIIEKIVQSKYPPKDSNVLWDDGENLKINRNGKWESAYAEGPAGGAYDDTEIKNKLTELEGKTASRAFGLFSNETLNYIIKEMALTEDVDYSAIKSVSILKAYSNGSYFFNSIYLHTDKTIVVYEMSYRTKEDALKNAGFQIYAGAKGNVLADFSKASEGSNTYATKVNYPLTMDDSPILLALSISNSTEAKFGYDIDKQGAGQYQYTYLDTPIKANSVVRNLGKEMVYLHARPLETFVRLYSGAEIVLEFDCIALKSTVDKQHFNLRVVGLQDEVAEIHNKTNVLGSETNVLLNKKITPNDIYGVDGVVNYFDEKNATYGYLADANVVAANNNYMTSGYIEVKGDTTYSFQGQRFIAEYDADKKPLSYKDINSISTVTTSLLARFVRVTFHSSVTYKGMYRTDISPRLYVPFERNIPFLKITPSSFEGVEPSKNLLNIDDAKKGYYLGGDGSLAGNTIYDTSAALAVTGGKMYYCAALRFIEQYNIDGASLKYTDLKNANQTIVLESDTRFVRVSYLVDWAYKAMLKLGEESEYAPYSVIVPFIKTNTRFSNKKMVCFGDSITASVEEREVSNWCMYVTEALGIQTTNVGLWSARVANVGADEVRDAFSLPRLVDGILSKDWSAQEIVYQTQGYEQHAEQLNKLKNIDFNAVDYVSISLGTNDLSSDTPFEIENEPLNPNSINGAFRYVISKLLAKYPHIKFIITTPIYRFEPSTGEDYVNNGRSIQDFVDDYLALGKELRVPVINLFNDISVNKYNKDYYWGSNGGDGLHPNHLMKELMGSKIAGGLNAML